METVEATRDLYAERLNLLAAKMFKIRTTYPTHLLVLGRSWRQSGTTATAVANTTVHHEEQKPRM